MLTIYLFSVVLVMLMLIYEFFINQEEIEILIALSPRIMVATYLVMLLFAPIVLVLVVCKIFFNQEL